MARDWMVRNEGQWIMGWRLGWRVRDENEGLGVRGKGWGGWGEGKLMRGEGPEGFRMC